MILFRQTLEEQEGENLAPYAILSKNSKWRKYFEKEDDFRSCFQRDRNRVLYSLSYRRLSRKTQVFPSTTKKDHIRNRLSHTNEVEQIARQITRNLGLNEDLTEVIAKAHDLWHSPYWHAWEQALNECMQKNWLSFEHNIQSRRLLEIIESKNEEYAWLNLSFEVLEWLGKHKIKTWFEEWALPYLEAQVVNIADSIAYLASDLDDWFRAWILKIDEIKKIKICKLILDKYWIENLNKRNFNKLIWNIINFLVSDIIINTDNLIKKYKIKSQKDVENSKIILVKFSDEINLLSTGLRKFLFDKYYNNKEITNKMNEWKREIKALFNYYFKNTDKLPSNYKNRINDFWKEICIADYISGMTDRYAKTKFRKFLA